MSGGNEAAWFAISIGAALKSTAVLGLAWSLALLLRGCSAAARHLVWTAAAAAILALPFLSVSLPALHVPAAALVPASTGFVFQTASTPLSAGNSQSGVQGGTAAIRQPTRWRPDWRISLMLLWAVGAAAGFFRMLVAGAALGRLRRRAKPFFDRDFCSALSRTMGIRRAVDVIESASGTMPMTFGVLRPAILMPADAAQWSEERKHIVLLHELAHVRRGDVATHWMARAAVTLYWWNPLAWTAWREFLKERERATDDLVLHAGASAAEYASHLLEVARTMQSCEAVRWAAVAMARRSQLEGRLVAILDAGINRKPLGRGSAWVAALLAVVVVAPLAAVRAQEIPSPAIPADVNAVIRAAHSRKNTEILENAAKAAELSRKYDAARKLLDAAVALRAELSGRHSVAYGLGLTKLGDLERKRRMHQSAGIFYTEAAQVLGDRPEAARALMYLGTDAVVRKDFARAIEYFQHAQRVDAAQAGAALMWMAVVRHAEQNSDEAERLYDRALSLQGPKSPGAAVTMRVYSQFLRQQGRVNQAQALDARAAAIQKVNVLQASPHAAVSGSVNHAGAGITPPEVLQKMDPEYSEEARAAKLQGTVVLSVEIEADGLAHNARVLRGLGLGLDENAIESVSQWRFRPGAKDGQPVTVVATIEINSRLL